MNKYKQIIQKLRQFYATSVCIAILLSLSASSHATNDEQTEKPDKNGVSTNVISLPSPPGSIKGLGEAFKPMLNTGTAKYAVALEVPPGPKGHAPELALTYDSGRGTGPCGIGWKIGPGAIQRQTNKGLPLYVDASNNQDYNHDGTIDDPNEIDTFLGPDGEELVELVGGTFLAKIENAFARYRRNGSGWEVYLRDGTRLEYGLSSASQITDSSGNRIFKWLLEKSTDTNGNTIRYTYFNEMEQGFENSKNQKYLREIRYGTGEDPCNYYVIQFQYQDRDDWYTDYSSGYAIRTTKLLKSVIVGYQIEAFTNFNFESGILNLEPITLIRRYDLDYEDGLSCSCLIKITQVGSDGVSTLPAITFTYIDEFIQKETVNAKIECCNTPSIVLDSELSELVDLNADSLPDILVTDYTGGRHTAFMNLGVDETSGKLCWDQSRTINGQDGFSTSLDLSSKAVHLADMDGDGKADLVYNGPSEEIFYCSNTGRGSWGPRRSMSIQSIKPPTPYSDKDIRISDFDGDKCIDVVRSTTTGYALWFNRGEGQYSGEVRTSGAVYNGQVIQFSDTAVHLADLNGDKLNDVVQVKPNHLIFCAHMGFGRYTTGRTISIPDRVLTSGPNGQVERATLEDINGDGLADLVVERATINTCWIWLNRGEQKDGCIALSACIVIQDMPQVRDSRMVTRWADMNGNGTTDLIYACSTSNTRLQIVDLGLLVRGDIPPNMLASIDNGLGSKTRIDYCCATDMYVKSQGTDEAWQSLLPIPVHVVSAAEVQVATLTGADYYETTYEYKDGYYDPNEKEFWGFAREETTQFGDDSAPTVFTASEFHTGVQHECLKGKVKSLDVHDSQKRYTRQENTWDFKVLYQGIDGRDVAFAYNTQTLSSIYEGLATPKYLLSQYKVDDWGHVIAELNYGVVGDPNDKETYTELNDEILAYTTYEPNTSAWLLDLKMKEDVNDYSGNPQALQRYTYDSAGNLLSQEAWLNTDNNWISVVRNVYDGFGNIIRIKNANNHYREISYDSLLNIYPTSELIITDNDPNHDLVLNVDYDYGYGQISYAKDFSGAETYFDYDVFGRLIAIHKPGGALSKYEYNLGSPLSSISTKTCYNNSNDTFDSTLYFDGLGRKLGSKIEAAPDPYSGLNRWRYVDAVTFNQRGLEKEKYLPYFTDSNSYELPDLNQSYVAMEYDAMDRVIKTINPDGTFSSVVYKPLTENLYDENDNNDVTSTPKTLVYDGQERLIKVTERNRELGNFYDKTYNVNEYITTYNWTTLGDLERITDAHGNVKKLQYDSLRRKTLMNDPDRGYMYYTYDPVGNLIRTKDAKEQEIEYRYDSAERILEEDWLDYKNGGVEVQYNYDRPQNGNDPNTRGKLAYVKDQVGIVSYQYDARGNIIKTIRGIEDTNALDKDYITSYTYDLMDRVQTVVAHNGQSTDYYYDNGNFVKAITTAGSNIISYIDYTAAGQQKSIDFGNNTCTNFDYDQRQRLSRLNTYSYNAGRDLLSYSYKYDPVSNIIDINDERPLLEQERYNTQKFNYDDLDRLISVRYPHINNFDQDVKQIDYRYDAIGNMLYKSSPNSVGHIDDDYKVNIGKMNYIGGRFERIGREINYLPGPHALTSTDKETYQYDRNGNMTQIEDANCTWDYRDRLVTYTKNGIEAHYTYDYTGRRIIKQVNDVNGVATNTIYPDKTFEIRPDSQEIFYVFNGDSHIAQYNNKDQKWLYYHTDHLGSSNVMTDGNGEIVQEMAYYPFGCTRNEYNPIEGKANYGFTGKEKDDESGLQYFEERYYLPRQGHFISVDPLYAENPIPSRSKSNRYSDLIKPPNCNMYSYVHNNPIRYIDQSGTKLTLLKRDRQALMTSLQALTDDKLGLKGGKVVILESHDGGSKPKGTELIRRLIKNTDYEVVVGSTDGRIWQKDISQNDATNGVGTSSIISLNLSKIFTSLEYSYKTGRLYSKSLSLNKSQVISLGHELIHAERSMRGKAINYKLWGMDYYIDSLGKLTRNYYQVEEMATIGLKYATPDDITENMLRGEQGLSVRGTY
ncbi:MAG: VCBS repeat-containing protein [Sedimentisphaerales bacterium]|nr:VCBS repeat-containing protein [Sedimentisphaerales bacterium]